MRYKTLDSLRGLAAAGVVLHHCIHALPPGQQQRIDSIFGHSAASLIWQGRPFVILFFVLSGFALASSLSPAGRVAYPDYVLRRLCRICLPYLAALGLSLGIFWVLAPGPYAGETGWVGSTWENGTGLHVLAQNLAMTGTTQGSSLDNVSWSLVYELRLSLLFPAFMWLAGRCGPVAAGLAAAALSLAGDAVLRHAGVSLRPYYAETPLLAAAATAHFAILFAVGALLAVEAARFNHFSRLAWPLQWFLFLLGCRFLGELSWTLVPALACFAAAAWPGLRRLEPALPRYFNGRYARWAGWAAQLGLVLLGLRLLRQLDDVLEGLGSAILIYACIISPWLGWLLLRRAPIFLGRISYSLYLVHVPVLAGLFHLLHGRLAPAGIDILAIALVVPLAALLHRLVEAPSQRLGRVLARRFFPVPAVPG